MVVKAIFFDFDGTICDTKDAAIYSFSKTLKELGYNFDEERISELLGVKIDLMLKILGLEKDDIKREEGKFYENFILAVDKNLNSCVSLWPIWEIRKRGIPLYVISNSRGDFLNKFISKLKISGLFSGVYGAEEFDTKDGMLSMLFEDMGIMSDEAIYVGDRFSDIRFAKKAGCISVAIYNECSWSTLEKIEKENPDFIINNFYELEKLIKKLNH